MTSLDRLPPPADRGADWKPDPLGVGAWRWWNGERWLPEVAGEPPGGRTGFRAALDTWPTWAKIVTPIFFVLLVLGAYLDARDDWWDALLWIPL